MISAQQKHQPSESDMSAPVARWLEGRGYGEIWHELRYETFTIDLVSKNPADRIIVVELKLQCSKWAICQAKISQVVANETYVATASRPHVESIQRCREQKIGLLVVNPETGSVRIVVEAPEIPPALRRADFLEYLESQPKRRVAGVPNVRDVEVEQTAAAVLNFIGDRKHVDWRDIFDAVPNKFENFREMKAAIWPRIKSKAVKR